MKLYLPACENPELEASVEHQQVFRDLPKDRA